MIQQPRDFQADDSSSSEASELFPPDCVSVEALTARRAAFGIQTDMLRAVLPRHRHQRPVKFRPDADDIATLQCRLTHPANAADLVFR